MRPSEERYRWEIRVVEMTLSLFRTLFSTCTQGGKGYLYDNPFHIVRVLYRKNTLCYAVSESLISSTEHELYEKGFGDWWLGNEVKVKARSSCIRQAGSAQVVSSSICAGPRVLPGERIEGMLQLEPPVGNWRDRIYLVPPCVAHLLMVPMLGNHSREDTKVELHPKKREPVPDQLDEFLRDIVDTASIVSEEGRELLAGVIAAGRALAEAKQLVVEARENILSEINNYSAWHQSERKGPYIRTTPKVYGLEVFGGGLERKYYKIGDP